MDTRAIRHPNHIRLLASPVRHELVDTLAALGGRATVSELALQLGRPADGLYYHLELLAEGGLVREFVNDAGERGFAIQGSRRAPLRLAYDLSTVEARDALAQYAKGLLQVAERDFGTALARSDVEVAGPRRELWAARNKGWVADRDLAEANRLLERLCELMSQTRDDERTRLMSLVFVLAPAPQKGKRRMRAPG